MIKSVIKASTYKTPPSIIEGICQLLDVLKTGREQYERAAFSVADPQFRYAISVLAQENNQYECELASQLSILGVNVDTEPTQSIRKTDVTTDQLTGSKVALPVQLLQYCRENEKQVINAYRKILNEPYLMDGVRKLMRTQLNGIMYAFLQLKLLSITAF
ncbi:hypothetical protein [Agriterribacter sp.]|uniref:hypothetical protein n=1 Tax=Agriterribacter sp. TaxID=2821509 RepID=UPI002C506536|nr:hypothetical protein [Agriterribacter sp.]HTN05108.1 hypothetical protein [Agriterribacter sp.]